LRPRSRWQSLESCEIEKQLHILEKQKQNHVYQTHLNPSLLESEFKGRQTYDYAIPEYNTVKVKLFLGLIKQYAIKTYGGVEE
jgi:hypothetical protein